MPQREGEVAAFGDFNGVLQRFGYVGKALGHHFGRHKILAVAEFARPFFISQYPAFGNANARFVGGKIVFLQKLGRVGGDHRQVQFASQFQAAGYRGFPLRFFRQAL